jgi:ribose transport system substrate-binding protein
MSRKLVMKGFIAVLAVVFTISAVQSVRLITADARAGALYMRRSEPARFHFMVILPTVEDDFFRQMWTGVKERAEELEAGVELQVSDSRLDPRKGTAELLEIARLAQVDGVALYVTDEEELRPVINHMVLSGIPLVTLESDAPMSRRSSFVGSNSFRLGQEIGELMREAQPEGVRAALLKNEFFSERASQWSVIKYGMLASLSSREGDIIVTELKSEGGVLSSEEKARQIMFLYPEVNVIFCTSPVDTISAANVVAEYRKAGEVKIIGYGDNQEVRRGLEGGYIYGTLIRDPAEIGRSGLEALVDLNSNKYVPSFIYIPGRVQKRVQE